MALVGRPTVDRARVDAGPAADGGSTAHCTAVSPYPAFDNEHRLGAVGQTGAAGVHGRVVIGAGLIWLAEPSLHTYYTQFRFRLDHPGTGTSFSQPSLPVWNRVISPLRRADQHRRIRALPGLAEPGGHHGPLPRLPGSPKPGARSGRLVHPGLQLLVPLPGHPGLLAAGSSRNDAWCSTCGSGHRLAVHIGRQAVVVLFVGPPLVALAIRDVGALATVIYAYLAFKLVAAIYSRSSTGPVPARAD